MNIEYRILWIDDDVDYIEGTRELVEQTIRDNCMEPVIKVYSKYQEYQETEIEKFDAEIFNLYDQIMIDYALSDGKTGDEIIKELRHKQIYTDIIFYSSAYAKMDSEMRQGDLLDGVFWTDRQDLQSAIFKIVQKNLRREFNITNIRGIIMDSSSEFDYICRITTLSLFEKLSPEKQRAIVQKAREFIGNAEEKANSNFSELRDNDGSKFLKKAINSTEYVMDNKDRYTLMSMVVRETLSDSLLDDNFSEEYGSKIIQPRNNLAHAKLYYGSCRKKLHVSKKREKHECDHDCESCKGKYSIDDCEKLRKEIFRYFCIFNDLNDRVEEYLKQTE